TLSSLTILLTVGLLSCVKESPLNENYWYSKEQGTVVYSSTTCSYYIVETANGYSVVRSISGYRPFENDVVYGDFSHYGARDIFDGTDRVVISGEIMDYWLTYNGANDALDYYCGN